MISDEICNSLLSQIERFPKPSEEFAFKYNYEELFRAFLKEEIEKLLEKNTIPRALELSKMYENVTDILLDNNRDNSEAIELYYKIDGYVESTLTGNAYLYTKQWGMSVLALYYYKEKQYEKASNKVKRCIEINDALVDKGMKSLLFRCISLNKLLPTVFFRMKEFTKGYQTLNNVLGYLISGNPNGLLGRTINNRGHWKDANKVVIEGILNKTFRDCVTYGVENGENIEDGRIIFNLLFGNLHFGIDTPDRLVMYNWIELKKRVYLNEDDVFVRDMIEFMNEPISVFYDILKIELLKDTYSIIKKSQCRYKDQIVGKIKNHLNTNFMSNQKIVEKVCLKMS